MEWLLSLSSLSNAVLQTLSHDGEELDDFQGELWHFADSHPSQEHFDTQRWLAAHCGNAIVKARFLFTEHPCQFWKIILR